MLKKYFPIKKQQIFLGFLLSFALAAPADLLARDEGVNTRLQGAKLLPGSQLAVEDNKMFHMEIHDPASNPSDPWTDEFLNASVLNKITFGIDESATDDLSSDFFYMINFDVELWRYENGAWTQTTESGLELKIDHKATYGTNLDRDIVSFENVHKSIITINSIVDANGGSVSGSSPAIEAVYLENAVEVERYYFFNPALVPNISNLLQEKSADNHLTLYWPFIRAAEQYDLEWTFVDHYAEDATNNWNFNFDQQATRVRVNETQYTLPLVFDEGYLLFRYRPVYASPLDGGLPVEGRWSTHNSGASGTVASYPSNAVHTVSPTASASVATESRPHETTMNWQYSAVYAEDSRSSHTVAYSDGLSKLRQQIAKLPTEDKTAVTSAIYDYTGRPTVQIMPVPMNDPELHYYHGLNQVNNGGSNEPFSARHFDDDDTYLDISSASTECDIDFPGLSVNFSLGAAKYYSDQNSAQEGMQAYVPISQDAYSSDKAYPFTLVQYTPDHTGRVKRQSGVGADLSLGSGNETRVYYDNPLPGELQFFFEANDIGDINSYRRVITKDANGQVSFQYLNNFDKVVISSLSPQNPQAYVPVNPGNPPQAISDLLEYATDEEPLSVSLTRFVEKGEEVEFRYFLDPQPYKDACLDEGLGAPQICFDCLYDLEINFKFVDECGNEVIINPTAPNTTTMSPMPYGTAVGDANYYNVNCETAGADRFEFPSNTYSTGGLSDVISLPENGYLTITKTLRVKPGAAEEYADLYVEELAKAKDNNYLNSSCDFKTKEDWICEQLIGMVAEIDDCKSYDCDDMFINDMAPTYMDEYETYYITLCGEFSDGSSCDPLDFETWMQTTYSSLYNSYIDDCTNSGLYAFNPCKSYREAMLADFMPGGQYAQYNVSNSGGTVTYSAPDNTSIFHIAPAGILVNYASLAVNYDLATYPIINGVAVNPNTLSIEEYILNFNPLWAEALLPFHPEYCYIQFCENNQAAFAYEAAMLATEDFNEARCQGFLNPQNAGKCTAVSIPTLPGGCTANFDPYTNANIQGYVSSLNHSSVGLSGGPNDCIWDAAMKIVHNTTTPPNAFGSDPCVEDREWQTFRSLYLMGRKSLLDQAFFSQFPTCYDVNKKLKTPYAQKIQRVPFYDFTNMNFGNLQDSLSAQWNYIIGGAGATANNMGICDVCDDYALMWKSKLTNCSGSSATLDNTVEAIRQLCQYQCTQSDGTYQGYQINPLGAVSLPNYNFLPVTAKGSYTAPSGTAYINSGGSSFYAENVDDILHQFYGSNWRNMSCNAFMISQPGPFGQNDHTRFLDGCGCDAITANEAEFASLSGSGNLPVGVTTEAQLFEYRYGHHLADYKNIRCACDNDVSLLLEMRIPFPTELTCDVCISCADIQGVITNFNSYFGLASLNDWTDTNIFPVVFTNFANVILTEQLGVNANGDIRLSFADYANLMNDCEGYCANQLIEGDNLTEHAYEIQEFLNDLIGHNMLDASSATPLPKYFDFYRNNLYECAFSGEEEVTTQTTTSSGSGFLMTVQLRDNAACTGMNCNCAFEGKDIDLLCTGCTSPINVDEIAYFDYIAADFTGAVLSAGEHYEFRITAVMNDGSTILFDECYVHREGTPAAKRYPVYNSIAGAFPSYCSGSGSYTAYMPQLCYPGLKYKERDPCTDDVIERAISAGELLYEESTEDLKEAFRNNYTAYCEGNTTTLDEAFDLKHNVNNAYTMLYYYDHLGNLVQTVPPEGVDDLGNKAHKMSTEYQYNSRNLPTQQQMPDHGYRDGSSWIKGTTKFAYNSKTQIVISQDEEQRAGKKIGEIFYPGYSYSLYDDLGRVIESGLIYGEYSVSSSQNMVDYAYSNGVQEIINHEDFPATISSTSSGASWTLYERSEVVRSRYDVALSPFIDDQFDGGQQNLLNRVASITYNEIYDVNPLVYNSAIHYSYDEMGNVSKIINDYPALDLNEDAKHRFKKVDYTFDLVSGNVKEVAYQKGEVDAFYHRYIYDQDNRLREVLTSSDHLHWDRDADYKYYEHGPLGRMELSDLKVQGEDIVYTLQGWLKGKNAADMEAQRDGGKDGHVGNQYFSAESDLHAHFAEDAASLGLYYHKKDYASVKDYTALPDENILPQITGTGLFNTAQNYRELYNGNISARLHQSRNVSGQKNPLMAARYRYDQLNRLRQANYYFGSALFGTSGANYSENQLNSSNDYGSEYVYDLNGNIKELTRSAYAAQGLGMDKLSYRYNSHNNQLHVVDDDEGANPYDDIEDQMDNIVFDETDSTTWNYGYDRIGNLIYDRQECIQTIEWTNAGKVKRIIRDAGCIASSGTPKPDMEFEYDPMGHRIRKTVKPRMSNGNLQNELFWEHTFYQRDAQGNVLAVYENDFVTDVEIRASFCFGDDILYYNPEHTNELNLQIFMSDGSSVFTPEVTLTGNNSIALVQALANSINGMQLENLWALAIDDCLYIFSSYEHSVIPTHGFIYHDWILEDGRVFPQHPFSISFQSFHPRDQFKLSEQHIYGSSRLGVKDRNLTLFDKYVTRYTTDPESGELTSLTYGQLHPTFEDYPCESFSGYCLLKLSNGGNNKLPYLDLGDGVNIFEGVSWTGGSGTAGNFLNWFTNTFTSSSTYANLKLTHTTSGLGSNEIKIGRYGMSNQNGKLPVVDDATSVVKIEIAGENALTDPKDLAFYGGHEAWENCEGQRQAGDKKYELSDHLGNVQAVVSDRKVISGDGNVIYTDRFDTESPGWNWNNNHFTIENGRVKVKSTNQFTQFRRDFDLDANSVYTLKFDADKGTVDKLNIVVNNITSGLFTLAGPVVLSGTHEVTFMTTNATKVRIMFQRNDPTSAGMKVFYIDNVQLSKNTLVYGEEFNQPVGSNWIIDESHTVTNFYRKWINTSAPGNGMQLTLNGLDDSKTYRLRCAINPHNTNLRFKLFDGSSWVTDEHVPHVYGGLRDWTFQPAAGSSSVTIRFERQNATGNRSFAIEEFVVIEDKNAVQPDRFIADILSTNDYYPFGMLMPGRVFNSPDYRYGFQGQEKDDELKGTGNSINYKYRMHDARIGRFFAVDPLVHEYPFYSPYSFSGNRVIDKIELEGLEPADINVQDGLNLILTPTGAINVNATINDQRNLARGITNNRQLNRALRRIGRRMRSGRWTTTMFDSYANTPANATNAINSAVMNLRIPGVILPPDLGSLIDRDDQMMVEIVIINDNATPPVNSSTQGEAGEGRDNGRNQNFPGMDGNKRVKAKKNKSKMKIPGMGRNKKAKIKKQSGKKNRLNGRKKFKGHKSRRHPRSHSKGKVKS